MSMDRRLGRLEMVWQADPQAISEASYSIEWALKWYPPDDPGATAQRIRETHGLNDAGVTRAIAAALTRCGVSRGEARRLASLELAVLLRLASEMEAA